MTPTLASSLTTLGYNPFWLEWGFLSEEMLQEQIARYSADPDHPLEHYRYAAFCRLLASRSDMTDTEVERYIALTQIDADLPMAHAALHDLLKWRGLTGAQFEHLSRDPRFAAPPFQRAVLRRRLLTALATSPEVSTPLFADCLASRDSPVQEAMIVECRLTPDQWKTLSEQGANRAIRNIARTRIRAK